MQQVLSHYSGLLTTVAGIVATFIATLIYFKWPSVKRFFRPDEFQRSIITSKDELEKEVVKLRNWKELLLDEVAILRKVDLLKTAKLDEANAEIVKLKTGVGRLLDAVKHDDLTR